MMKNERLGAKLFRDFEKRIEDKTKTSFALIAEPTASDLILFSPYVTDHLIAGGLINRGEHSCFAPVFTANLSAQLYGTSESRGYKLTVRNADKRAGAVTMHTLNNCRKITDRVKARRKTEIDLFLGLRSAALVESLQCDYIAGTALTEQAETAAGIALLRRFSRELPKFRQFMATLGVDVRDAGALRQFANEGKLRSYLQDFYSDSLYFQRRQGLIVQKRALADVTDNVNALRRTKGALFTEGAIAHVISELGLDYEAISKRLVNRAAA